MSQLGIITLRLSVFLHNPLVVHVPRLPQSSRSSSAPSLSLFLALSPRKGVDQGSIPGQGENFGQIFFTPNASVYPAVIGNLDVNRLADRILG